MSKKHPYNSGVLISKARFICAYCGLKRTGPYRWVDNARSCERCNREQDSDEIKHAILQTIKPLKIECPLCKGTGLLCGKVEK